VAYVEPPTFTAASTATAADANILSEDIRYLKGVADGVAFSGARVGRTTNQSISTATATNISWTVETFDFGGWYSSGTNVVVPAGAIPSGYTTIAVLVITRARFASNSTGYRRLAIKLNGTAYNSTSVDANSGAETEVNVTDFVTAAAADIITIEAYQTSGGALNCEIATCVAVRFAPAS
jgi:hypothetical protein